MIYPTYWDPAHVRTIFTTESRQKSRDLFLQTHRPFQKIRVDFCKDGDATGTFIDEAQVRQIIDGGALDAHNRLFFIVGEAGCGKSELCQWLEYTIDVKYRLPIHVPRSMTNAANVVALLRQKLDQSGAAVGLRAPFATQAEYILLAAVVLLYERGEPLLTPADRWAELLRDRELRQSMADLLEAGGNTPVLDEQLLGLLCVRHGLTIFPEQMPQTMTALRHLLAQAVDQTLWLSDLRALLARLSSQTVLQGRRPLLLIEDITAFQTLGDLLLDYLLDLSSGHFDAVIGVTTGFERTQLAGATLAGDLTHIHHRLRARFVLTDQQGRAYGLEEELITLARTYLRAVKPYSSPADLEQIFGTDLYPLTPTALRRAFDSLHEEGNPRQTPRLLIEQVLGATLLGDTPPPNLFDRSPYLRQPPTLFRTDEVNDEQLRSLLRWYGEIQDEVVTLDIRIAELWGIPVPPQLVRDDMICVPRAYVAATSERADISVEWQRELRELQQWLSGSGYYPSRETLKRGIERTLLSMGDPRALGSRHAQSLARAEIYYARGDERLPIMLSGSGDQSGASTSVTIQITGGPDERAILEELVYASLSGAELAHVCQNLALTLEWTQRTWDSYHAEVHASLRERLGGIDSDQLIFVSWRLLCALVGIPWDERPHVRPLADANHGYAENSPWSPTQHAACYKAGEALASWYEPVRRLFIGSFTLRDTLLDRRRCEALADTDINAIVALLAQLPLRSLRSLPYKIRPGGQRLYDLLVPLQRYAQAIIDLDVDVALHADLVGLTGCGSHLEAQSQLDCALLRQQLATLRWRCGEVGVRWREVWETALEPLEHLDLEMLRELSTHVSALQDECQVASEIGCTIWHYQSLRHKIRRVLDHSYWRALTTLRTVQAELEQIARARYRRDGRALSATRAYRDLLSTARGVWEELSDG